MRRDVTLLDLWARRGDIWVNLASPQKNCDNAGDYAIDLENIPARLFAMGKERVTSSANGSGSVEFAEAAKTNGALESELSDESAQHLFVGPDDSEASVEAGFVVSLYVEVERILDPVSPTAHRLLQRPSVESVLLPNGCLRVRYRMQLGRFADTFTEGLGTYLTSGPSATPYVSKRGCIVMAVARSLKPYASVHVQRLSCSRGRLVMRGTLFTRHGEVTTAELQLRGRLSGFRVSLPMHATLDKAETRIHSGLRRYRFSACGNWGELLNHPEFGDDVYDAWAVVNTLQIQEPAITRVGKTRFRTQYLTRPGWVRRGSTTANITPYYTFKAKKTSFQVDLFDASVHAYLRRSLPVRHILRAANRRRRIWLVGERPYKAQDTGYHFFRYLRESHPEIDAYYVIDPTSTEVAKVRPLGNVLALRSKEHVRATLLAERIIGSHHPDFLYPLRTKRFRRAITAPKVFLQHGVMGTKWMVPNYGKSVQSFDTDLFVVSSDREKEYIINDFGYKPSEVAVTGLSRFDALLTDDVGLRPRQLLVIPTWRDWLQGHSITDSDYFDRWVEFMQHPRLMQMVKQDQLEVVFCLHPNMQRFRRDFESVPARIIAQGEVDVQYLLKESAILVTDYSSVGFDFSFLHKPVIYYQFDRDRFLGRWGSHLDLDAELPGPIVKGVDSLLDELQKRLDDGFRMSPGYVRRADRFLTYRDQHSNERIFQRVLSAKSNATRLERLMSRELPSALARWFRRSQWYFPVMRKCYLVARKVIPIDRNLVLFESGLGKQYADSPRAIYEELVRRNTSHTKVWAYTHRLPAHDHLTKVVPRLSPQYFWYMARAGYWINNQSFPHYFKVRPGATFVQTWHGTPLKRMLFDLDEISGRDPGYISRVSRAVRQWSILVSASPFMSKAIASAYRYTGPTLETGYPRNDIFFRSDASELALDVRAGLGVPNDAYTILYAPTFRDNRSAGGTRFHLYLPLDLEQLMSSLPDNAVLMLRMHVLIKGQVRIPAHLQGRVIDVTSYPDIQELLLAADALVTDYSSVFFDYANLKRPIVFFAPDLAEYRDNLRGFYLDYERELPGPVVTNDQELATVLSDVDGLIEGYSRRYADFLARFSPFDDGRAAERVVTHIFGPSAVDREKPDA